jgi:predicted DNA-binding WGR domain protein
MVTQAYRLYIERIDATRNMARFYALEIGSTLFGDVCLTRTWGRIGTHGQMKAHHFASEAEAVELFFAFARRKLNRGYRPRQDSAAVAGRTGPIRATAKPMAAYGQDSAR